MVTLQSQSVTLSNDLPGRTSAYRLAEVRPPVDGVVLKRLCQEGEDIKAGQQLYQIDPSTYGVTLASAQASRYRIGMHKYFIGWFAPFVAIDQYPCIILLH